MGERIGFCFRDETGRSQIFRQQWMTEPETAVKLTWNTLGGKPGDGGQALRDDLGIDRAFAALVYSIYQEPFDSIHDYINCDINDHGLVEIDITQFDNWKVNHIPILYHPEDSSSTEAEKYLYATMSKNGFVKTNGDYEI
jgi:hypothetical protein